MSTSAMESRSIVEKYDAFISYSHRVDLDLGSRIQAAIERIGKPWYRLRVSRVFRDQTDLTATPGLWSTILSELERSRYFILLASPEAARSHWVGAEVERWLAIKSRSSLLIAVTAGEIVWDEAAKDFDWQRTSALPTQLRKAFEHEPLWVDLRAAHDAADLSPANLQFMSAIARLAAPIRGLELRALFDQHRREHLRTLRHAWTAALVLAALTILSLFLYQRSNVRLVDLYVAQAHRELADGRPGRAATYLSAAQSEMSVFTPESRGMLVRQLLRQALPSIEAQAAVLTRHENPVTRVAHSDDGRFLVTADDAGNANLWDARAGNLLGSLGPLGGPSSCLDFDGSGERLVTCSRVGTKVWSTETRSLLFDAADPGPLATSFARFSRDGSLLAVAVAGEVPALFNAARGVRLAWLREHRELVMALAFSPNGHLLVTGSIDRTARVYEASTGVLVRELVGQKDAIVSVAVDPTNERVAAASTDGTVRIYEIATGIVLHELTYGSGLIHHTDVMALKLFVKMAEERLPVVAFSADGRRLFTADENNIGVWDLDRDERIAEFRSEHGPFFCFAFSPDGRLVATGEGDDTIRLWGLAAGELVATLDSHTGPVRTIAFSPDGTRLVSGSEDRLARTWVIERAITRRILRSESTMPGSISFSRDGAALEVTSATRMKWSGGNGIAQGTLTSVWDLSTLALLESRESDDDPFVQRVRAASGIVVRWDANGVVVTGSDGQERVRLQGSLRDISAADVSTDGKYVVTGASDGTVRLWDLSTGTAILSLAEDRAVKSVRYSRDGRWVVTIPFEGPARLWDAQTGALRWTLGSQDRTADEAIFGPDGKLILIASAKRGIVDAWAIASAEIVYSIKIPTERKYTFIKGAFSSDSRLFVTAARGRAVRLWDGKTGSLLSELQVPDTAVFDAAFTPNDENIIATTSNGMVVVFPVSPELRSIAEIEHVLEERGGFRISSGRLVPNRESTLQSKLVPLN